MEFGEIKKGKDKIVVSFKEFKGKHYIDIRTYFENENGEWLPTKKGITFSADLLDEMCDILNNARKNINASP